MVLSMKLLKASYFTSTPICILPIGLGFAHHRNLSYANRLFTKALKNVDLCEGSGIQKVTFTSPNLAFHVDRDPSGYGEALLFSCTP